jgi:hypothetical protein
LNGIIRMAKSEMADLIYDDKFKKTIYITVRYNIFLIYFGSSTVSSKTDFQDLEHCLLP